MLQSFCSRVTKGDEEQMGERQSAQCRCAGAARPYPAPTMACKLDLVEAERAVNAPPSPRAPVGANPVMGDDDVPAIFKRSSVYALQRPGTGLPKHGHLSECRANATESDHPGGVNFGLPAAIPWPTRAAAMSNASS
jgi:hypothetical protein